MEARRIGAGAAREQEATTNELHDGAAARKQPATRPEADRAAPPDPGAASARGMLDRLGSEIHDGFVQRRMLLSFEEYLDLFIESPRRHARSAAQYLADAILHFGVDEVRGPLGVRRRFRVFDREFDGGEGRVAGHEDAQTALFQHISNFVRVGRVNKLILLHGPNGSAKSSMVTALIRGLEHYSLLDEGARYRFNWIFPVDELVKGGIGFGSSRNGDDGPESFAHLEGEAIAARISCDMKDPPLFLIPREQRRELLSRAVSQAVEEDVASVASFRVPWGNDFVLSNYMLDGELCPKCRSIYTTLLAHYGGDYLKVLRHVQVERFHVSRRYLVGSATVEPQLSVDAEFRPVSLDRSAASLPTSLQNLTLYESAGALVSGNRGVVEFSDLLKRPLEAWKYLLNTSENAVVSLLSFQLQLDSVLIASTNEKHLAAFKSLPDFSSFKGRIELVRVPYLRRMTQEKQIYDDHLAHSAVGRHVAPHATRVAAVWAVLTRLKKPRADTWRGAVRQLIDELTPYEKLVLYDEGHAPDRMSMSQARELRGKLQEVYRESDSWPNYEGLFGASARELKTILNNAAQHPDYRCLSPMAVLEGLRELVKEESVYEFLQQEVVDGFHDHTEFVEVAREDYLDVIDEEIRDSMGMVSERQYRELFERYVQHVSAWIKGERIRNRITGEYRRPDEDMMADTEAIVMGRGQDRREFRRSLIASVGAYRLDHPDSDIDYRLIFPDLFRKLRDHYHEERKDTLRRNKENVLRYLGDERDSLLDRDRRNVETMLATMSGKYGYCEHCARDAILFLMKERYAE